MTTVEMLLALCAARGIAGMESGAVDCGRTMLDGLGATCETTPLGSLICRIKTAPADRPHLMLTAHIDEIGLIVTYIDDAGFLRVSNCGGIDRSMLLAAQVVVHTAAADFEGVVCTIPPHLNPDDSKIPKIEDIYIDVGLDAESARAKITPGDRVSFRSEAAELLDGRLCAQTLDDRSGCAAVILAARQLADVPLNCSVSVVLATMEEVGGQGAKTAAFRLSPTHAIAVDVGFGVSHDVPRHKGGELGKGVMLGVAPILDNGMLAGLKATAEKEKIAYQYDVMGGNTGTDADGIAATGAGVRCALLSIPQRYMHTPIEVVAVADVEAVANLIAAYVRDTFGGER